MAQVNPRKYHSGEGYNRVLCGIGHVLQKLDECSLELAFIEGIIEASVHMPEKSSGVLKKACVLGDTVNALHVVLEDGPEIQRLRAAV